MRRYLYALLGMSLLASVSGCVTTVGGRRSERHDWYVFLFHARAGSHLRYPYGRRLAQGTRRG